MRWKQTGENVTYSAWFKGKDIPDKENLFSYGGADCAGVLFMEDFMIDFEKYVDDDENDDDNDEDDKQVDDGDFKWFIRTIPLSNVKMSTLCKL